MTTKQRSELKSKAQTEPVVLMVGKNGITAESIISAREAH
jgi:RNA-binding protein YhbY